MRKILFIMLVMLIMITEVMAQTYSISGKVRGLYPYVNGALITLSGDVTAETYTYHDGSYIFYRLPAGGNYTVSFTQVKNIPWIKCTNPHSTIGASGNTDIQISVIPWPEEITFTPQAYTYTALSSDQVNQDFQLQYSTSYKSIDSVSIIVDNNPIDSYYAQSMPGFNNYYTYTWDTTSYTKGSHTLEISAIDSSGATGSTTHSIIVNNSEMVGDGNLNDVVDIVDALIITQTYVGHPIPGFDYSMVDVNLDGSMNIVDALLIAQHYVGLISELPPLMPGGYSQISIHDSKVSTAYGFLKYSMITSHPDVILKNVKFAHSQVAAGMNIRLLCIYCRIREDGGLHRDASVAAVVFMDFNGVPQTISDLRFRY